MSKDDERWWNFIIFKVWATNEELEEMTPIFGVIILVVIAVGLIWCGINSFGGLL